MTKAGRHGKKKLSRHASIIIVTSFVSGDSKFQVTVHHYEKIEGSLITSVGKTKEHALMHASVQLVFFTHLQFRIPCLGTGAIHSEVDFPISVNVIKIMPKTIPPYDCF